MVEYALVLVLVSIVVVTLLLGMTGWLSNVFSSVASSLNS
jgi:Flp pilus assembly pilin Flp